MRVLAFADPVIQANRPSEAAEVLEQAAARFEQKGNLVSFEHARGLAERLAAEAVRSG